MEDREVLIWKYLDNDCNGQEQVQFNQLLNSDPSFKQAYENAMLVHQSLLNNDLDSPSMGFTANVLSQIAASGFQQASIAYKKFFSILITAMIIAFGINSFIPGHGQSSGLLSFDFINQLKLETSIFSWIPSSSLYVIIICSVLFFYWTDQYLSKHNKV